MTAHTCISGSSGSGCLERTQKRCRGGPFSPRMAASLAGPSGKRTSTGKRRRNSSRQARALSGSGSAAAAAVAEVAEVAAIMPKPADCSGPGASSRGSWYAGPSSGTWNEAARLKIVSPCWTASTRRVVNEPPSLTGSTVYRIGAPVSPGRRK